MSSEGLFLTGMKMIVEINPGELLGVQSLGNRAHRGGGSAVKAVVGQRLPRWSVDAERGKRKSQKNHQPF